MKCTLFLLVYTVGEIFHPMCVCLYNFQLQGLAKTKTKNMKENIIVSETPEKTIQKIGDSIHKILKNKKKPFYMLLSGGETPQELFRYLVTSNPDQSIWNDVHFFWADERCVPPDNEESNYKTAMKLLLRPLKIPPYNIHRIWGEKNPSEECFRYENEILNVVPSRNGVPQFDLILLGMGDDGHTASLFPGQWTNYQSDRICEVAFHPATKQKRITITPKIIHSAEQAFFLITGKNKSTAVEKVFKGKEPEIPAHLFINNNNINWFMDQSASQNLEFS